MSKVKSLPKNVESGTITTIAGVVKKKKGKDNLDKMMDRVERFATVNMLSKRINKWLNRGVPVEFVDQLHTLRDLAEKHKAIIHSLAEGLEKLHTSNFSPPKFVAMHSANLVGCQVWIHPNRFSTYLSSGMVKLEQLNQLVVVNAVKNRLFVALGHFDPNATNTFIIQIPRTHVLRSTPPDAYFEDAKNWVPLGTLANQ